ncbi:MAG TPA: cytochrome P450, partial [Polyangiaceae bacterium]
MGVEAFDPFSASVMLEPFEHYRWLRENAPVYHVPDTDIWVVSRYDDADHVLRNHQIFSSAGGIGPEWDPHPMLSMYDPPEHTRLRRLIAARFTPKFVAAFADGLRDTTDRLLEPVLAAGGGDLVTQIAQPLAGALIADLLGIPEDRREDFRRWSTGIVATLSARHSPDAAREAEATRVAFVSYLRELVARRTKATAGSDIISLLLRAHEEEVLTPKEVIAFCVLLLVAGYETTINGLANVINVFAQSPGAWDRLKADTNLLRPAIEEALRYDSPDQAFFRNTVSNADLRAGNIPSHSKVMVLLGSANRDESKYPDGARFELTRNPSDHLAFGSGVHYCLGAPLA